MTTTVTSGPDAPEGARRGLGHRAARVVDVLVVLAVVVPFADVRAYSRPGLLISYAGLWMGIALVFVVIRLVRLRRSRRDDPLWDRRLLGRRLAYMLTAATSFQIIGYGLTIPVFAAGTDVLPGGQATGRAVLVVAVLTLIVAWSVLHLSYAERYARLWLLEAGDSGTEPIAFPGTPSPRLRDFAYFSVTIGLSFATSDPEIRSSRIRAVVLWHSVLSFAYNTAILGMVVGLIAG